MENTLSKIPQAKDNKKAKKITTGTRKRTFHAEGFLARIKRVTEGGGGKEIQVLNNITQTSQRERC